MADCGANVNSNEDNTHSFISCNQKLGLTGGCVFVPSGTYQVLNVPLNTSNIIYYMDKNVTFVPFNGITNGYNPVFFLGKTDEYNCPKLTRTYKTHHVKCIFGKHLYITNVSIIGASADHKFVIDTSNQLLFVQTKT